MDITIRWEEKLINKEILKKAYEFAQKLHLSFAGEVGSASYFNSLAIRMPELFGKDRVELLKNLKDESSRGSVSGYWETKNINDKSLLENVESIISDRSLIHILDEYYIEENGSEYQRYHLQFIKNVFHYMADLIVLEEKKNDRNDQ